MIYEIVYTILYVSLRNITKQQGHLITHVSLVDVWYPTIGYTFNSNLQFWYKVVHLPEQKIQMAKETCKADGSYLILIENELVYNFVVDIMGMYC